MHQGVIIVNPHVKPDHGDYIVLKNAEDEAVFKQLKKYGKARILHPLNPNYPDIELSDKHQYRVIGKVVEKKKRY
jgi:SOS-response transcriptional repressor LexA